jgi:hypothetical protein
MSAKMKSTIIKYSSSLRTGGLFSYIYICLTKRAISLRTSTIAFTVFISSSVRGGSSERASMMGGKFRSISPSIIGQEHPYNRGRKYASKPTERKKSSRDRCCCVFVFFFLPGLNCFDRMSTVNYPLQKKKKDSVSSKEKGRKEEQSKGYP